MQPPHNASEDGRGQLAICLGGSLLLVPCVATGTITVSSAQAGRSAPGVLPTAAPLARQPAAGPSSLARDRHRPSRARTALPRTLRRGQLPGAAQDC